MRYPAKELKAEAYKAYSKDAFNDEERGVAYYLHNYRYKLTAGEIDKFDDIQCVPIDTMHYIDTALPGNDIIILTAADNSDKKIPMSLVDWFWTIDRNLIEWYNVGNKQSSGEYKVSVPSRLYEKWANYQRRPNSYKKQHPKPSTKDGVLIENCGIDYYFKTTFFASRAYAEIVYKKYTHVHGTPKLEWLAVPECVPISNLELDDYIFYERESALNLAIEISSALIDCHELDKAHGNGNRIFYNITLFELKQRLLPDLLKSDAIYFRIAVARTFIYALRSRLTDQMNSGWEDADSQTQYRKIEAWVAQIASYLRNILRNPPRLFAESEHTSSEEIHALIQMHYTNVTGYYSTHFPRLGPPYTREAPAHFIRKGKHYLLTSGTTGYFPNPSELAIADTWHGPYRVLGDPHPADDTRTSFHSQISSVFRVPGKKASILHSPIAGCRRECRFPMKNTVFSLNASSAVTRMPFIRRSSRKKRWISASKTPYLPTTSGCRFDLTERWPILTGWTSGNLKTMNRLHSLHF